MPTDPLLAVRNLSKTYQHRRWWGGNTDSTSAIRDITFTLDAGRTLAVVGPSGSGKSTLARCLAFFEVPTSGEIAFQGQPREVQLILQQPAASLNPRFTAAEVIEEPLVIQRRGAPAERRQRAVRAMEQVGLSPAGLGKGSDHFSGGEKQRLAIARALVLEPKLIILDESLTGIDAALQVQITELLRELQARLGITFILISHDLALAAGLATEIAVMDHGAMVERAPAAKLLAAPRHPLTRELLAATMALTV